MIETTNQQNQQLLSYLARWDQRLRLAQLATWVPRGLLAGLTLGLALAVLSRLRPLLFGSQVLVIAIIAALIGAVAAAIGVLVWPRPALNKARYFDGVFGLKERTSTALELKSGTIKAPGQFVDLQMRDALDRASQVQVGRHLHPNWRRNELLAALIILLLLALALLLTNPQSAVLAQQAQIANAIDQQIKKLEQVQQNIQGNPALSEAEKAQLNKILQEAIEQLQQPNITQAEAVAALSQAQQEMKNAQTQLTPEQQASAQEAASALNQSQSTQNLSQSLQSGKLGDAANQLQNLAQKVGDGQLTNSQMSDTANALNQAANAMQGLNPQAADALRRAAEALQKGDLTGAQQALQDAANALNQQQQQMNQTPMTQSAQNASQQMSQGQQQLAQAGQQSQQGRNSQQGQQSQQGQSGQNQQSQSQGQQSQQGQQSGQQSQQGQGQDPQSGQQSGQQGGQQGDQAGQQSGGQQPSGNDGNAQSQGGQNGQGLSQQDGQAGSSQGVGSGQQNGVQGSSQAQSQGQNGGGAGQGAGGAGDNVTSGVGQNNGPIDANNGHTNNGNVVPYEKVYAPSFIGGSGGKQLNPTGSTNGNGTKTTQEGDFSNNPTGQSTVPIGSVSGQAASEADRAMDADHIPGGLRGVVRDYFTGLQSGQQAPR